MSITLTHVKGPEAGSPNKQLHHSDISVPLPAVLGRGALLKCAEKKVSRRHATLDWDDDGVIINSVNPNPTFVIVSGKKQKLDQGESVVLGHGDKFGLLEDAFWFRVTLENFAQSSDKENALTNNSEDKSDQDNIKESNSLQENRNNYLNQNKQIIINKENSKLEESNGEENEINVKSKEDKANKSTVAKENTVSDNNVKNIPHLNASFFTNDKMKASEGTSNTSTREEIKINISSRAANTSNQPISSSNEEASTSSHGVARVSLSLYTQKDLDNAITDRKRTLPAWMSGLTSSTNKATSNKKDSSNPVQHGRKNNKASPKKQNKSRLKDDSSIINSDDVGETGEKKKRGPKKSPSKNNPSKYHGMSQIDDEELEEIKAGTTINERKEKLEKNKSPLKRSPKASPSKKTPLKYHGLSQEFSDEGILEEDDIKIKNITTDNLHYLSEDGSDDNAQSPQKNLPSPRKLKTPNKNITSSDNEGNGAAVADNIKIKNVTTDNLHYLSDDGSDDNAQSPQKNLPSPRKLKTPNKNITCSDSDDNGAEVADNKTKVTVGSRLAGVTTTSSTNTSTDDAGCRGRKRNAPRASCQYGSQCYRKNPQHKDEYCHPGDSDYNDDDDDDEDDGGDDDDERPECEFGVDCYRKNPQHRKQFKHTRFPQPQRKAKRKAKAKKHGSGESESDDYDYDDPFLNDDSSDDYAPTDSGSDTNIEDNVEEEDTERMLKEGKKFVKKN